MSMYIVLTPTPQRRPLQNRADPDQAALVTRSGSTPFVHGKHDHTSGFDKYSLCSMYKRENLFY